MRRVGFAFALAVVATVSVPSPVAAGTYDVYACGGAGGAAHHAFSASADANMEAYAICPPESAVGTGIVTKASSRGGSARAGTGAYQVFTAPPGTSLHSVHFNVGAIRLNGDWSVGVVAYDGDFLAGDYPFGCYPWNAYCGIGTPVFSITVGVGLYGHQRFRFETRCVNPAGCSTAASTFTPANRALFSAANVVVHVQDTVPPSLVPHHGGVWRDGWHRGVEEAWTSHYDGAGIMITRLYVGGVVRETQDYRDGSWGPVRCDFTHPRPCVDIAPGRFALDTTQLPDGPHRVDVEAVDPASNAYTIGHTIHVDNHAPVKPENVGLAGGEGWRGANDFTVGWDNPPAQVAPIARARYRLCRADGGSCVEGARDGDGIAALRGLQVPGPGEWLARVWLEDAAGNHDPARSGDPVRLRFDDEAPNVAFTDGDAQDPRIVRAEVSDAGSGVQGGSIELRPLGSGGWRDLGARLHGSRLVAEVDDLALADGVYELRAHVRDLAGNERTTGRRADGSPMRLTLPLRAAGTIALTARVRCRRKARPRARRCTRPVDRLRGNGRTIRGLLRAGGAPVALAPVTVLARSRTGAPLAPLETLRTGAAGRFSLRIDAGPSRTLRFRWFGTRLARPAEAGLRVLVPARSSIAVDRRRVPNGETVTFTGRLIGGPVPEGGKLIDLQAHYRGRWRTFATPRTGATGRWAYPYRFEATRGLVRYRFRARIRREAAYPYELGHSRVVRVVVRG